MPLMTKVSDAWHLTENEEGKAWSTRGVGSLQDRRNARSEALPKEGNVTGASRKQLGL